MFYRLVVCDIVYYCCLRIFFSDIIHVELPSSPPPINKYTLDVDPIDREYLCLDTNNSNNNNTQWINSDLDGEGNLLNIYSWYERKMEKGINEFECYAGLYLGTMMVDIIGK